LTDRAARRTVRAMPRDATDTRERILEAATQAFAAAGFAGASVRMIAGAAGVNVATLSYHFVDKRGLYAAVVARYFERIAETPRPAPDDDDWVRTLVGALWRSIRAEREGLRVLMRHALDAGHLDMEASRVGLGLFVDEVVARTDLPPARAYLVVTSFGYLLSRYAVNTEAELRRVTGSDEPERVLLDHLVELASRAIQARAP
jgi:AcrR family transcriptional regulator